MFLCNKNAELVIQAQPSTNTHTHIYIYVCIFDESSTNILRNLPRLLRDNYICHYVFALHFSGMGEKRGGRTGKDTESSFKRQEMDMIIFYSGYRKNWRKSCKWSDKICSQYQKLSNGHEFLRCIFFCHFFYHQRKMGRYDTFFDNCILKCVQLKTGFSILALEENRFPALSLLCQNFNDIGHCKKTEGFKSHPLFKLNQTS